MQPFEPLGLLAAADVSNRHAHASTLWADRRHRKRSVSVAGRHFQRTHPQLQLFPQFAGAEQDRQEMDALGFAEIEQSRQPGGKQPPGEPLVVGEAAQLPAVLPHDQGPLFKLQPQARGLNQQKHPEQHHHQRGL